MTSPVITIHPDATLSAAAKLMNAHRMRRLPVVNAAGDLIGIVSRRDLMKVFLRPDEEITAEVSDVLAQILLDDAGQLTVSVLDGVVTLGGGLDDEDLISVAVGLASGVDGVVAVSSTDSPAKKHMTGCRPQARRRKSGPMDSHLPATGLGNRQVAPRLRNRGRRRA